MITVRTKNYTEEEICNLRYILTHGINTVLCSLYDECDTCTNRVLCRDINKVIAYIDKTNAHIKRHRKSK